MFATIGKKSRQLHCQFKRERERERERENEREKEREREILR